MAKCESFSTRPEFRNLPLSRKIAIAAFIGRSIKHNRTSNDWNVTVTSVEIRRNSKGGKKLELVPLGSIPPESHESNQNEIFFLGNIVSEGYAVAIAEKHGARKDSVIYIPEENKDQNQKAVLLGKIDLTHITERQKASCYLKEKGNIWLL